MPGVYAMFGRDIDKEFDEVGKRVKESHERQRDHEAQLAYSAGQLEQSRLYADYWMAVLNSGAAKRIGVTKYNGDPLTDEEKVDHVLTVIKQHIHNHRETLEFRDGLIRGETK